MFRGGPSAASGSPAFTRVFKTRVHRDGCGCTRPDARACLSGSARSPQGWRVVRRRGWSPWCSMRCGSGSPGPIPDATSNFRSVGRIDGEQPLVRQRRHPNLQVRLRSAAPPQGRKLYRPFQPQQEGRVPLAESDGQLGKSPRWEGTRAKISPIPIRPPQQELRILDELDARALRARWSGRLHWKRSVSNLDLLGILTGPHHDGGLPTGCTPNGLPVPPGRLTDQRGELLPAWPPMVHPPSPDGRGPSFHGGPRCGPPRRRSSPPWHRPDPARH